MKLKKERIWNFTPDQLPSLPTSHHVQHQTFEVHRKSGLFRRLKNTNAQSEVWLLEATRCLKQRSKFQRRTFPPKSWLTFSGKERITQHSFVKCPLWILCFVSFCVRWFVVFVIFFCLACFGFDRTFRFLARNWFFGVPWKHGFREQTIVLNCVSSTKSCHGCFWFQWIFGVMCDFCRRSLFQAVKFWMLRNPCCCMFIRKNSVLNKPEMVWNYWSLFAVAKATATNKFLGNILRHFLVSCVIGPFQTMICKRLLQSSRLRKRTIIEPSRNELFFSKVVLADLVLRSGTTVRFWAPKNGVSLMFPVCLNHLLGWNLGQKTKRKRAGPSICSACFSLSRVLFYINKGHQLS